MAGLGIGLICGFAEFYLLTKLTAAFISGSPKAIYYILAKVVLLAVTLGAGVLFVRDQLILLGVGIAAPLMICSVVFFFRTYFKTAGAKTKELQQKNPDGDEVQ